MARCPDCSATNDSDWSHCNRCGTPLDQPATDTTEQALAWPALVGVSVMVTGLAAFLPWAVVDSSLFTLAIAGVEGDGLLTLSLAVAIGVTTAVQWRPWGARLALLGGLAVALTALATIYDAWGTTSVEPAVGAYATLVGGLGMFLAGVAGVGGPPHEEPSSMTVERHSPEEFDDGTLRAIAVLLAREQIADAETIQREVFIDHREGHRSREQWWADVRERLEDDRRFNAIDDGDRWALARR